MILKLSYKIIVTLLSTTIVFSQPQLTFTWLFSHAKNYTFAQSTNIYEFAKQITVEIEGGTHGSGVIIAKEDNTYYVLTAWHVIQSPDQYLVVTNDLREHQAYRLKRLSDEIDLGILEFTSNQEYEVATLGDSEQISIGTKIYVAGFPEPTRHFPGREFTPTEGNIIKLRNILLNDGYTLGYTNPTRKGMSGGPVLDEQSFLVGIHGRAESEIFNDEKVIGWVNLGIAINTFKQIATDDLLALINRTQFSRTIASPTQLNYDQLQKLLSEGRWQNANDLTWALIKQVGDKNNSGKLAKSEVRELDCSSLKRINRLWQESSNNHFGFRTQSYSYQDMGNAASFNAHNYILFGKQVGWYANGRWLSYNELNWSKNAPKGHLPAWFQYRESPSQEAYGFEHNNPEASQSLGSLLVNRIRWCQI